MSNAYQQLFVGLAFAVVLIYLLIVVNFQSWLDPFRDRHGAAKRALAGIVWMLFATETTLSVSGAHRRDHVHGRLPPQTAFWSSASRASAWRQGPMRFTAALEGRQHPISGPY